MRLSQFFPVFLFASAITALPVAVSELQSTRALHVEDIQSPSFEQPATRMYVRRAPELLGEDGVTKRGIEEASLEKRSFWDFIHRFLSGTGQPNPTVAEPVANPATTNSKRADAPVSFEKRSFWDFIHRFFSGTGQPNPTVAEPVARPATTNDKRDIEETLVEKRSFWDFIHRFLSGTGQPNPTVAEPVANPGTTLD